MNRLPSEPYVVGHRGDGRSPRENTTEAFDAARDLGALWVELDVVPTADGRLVMNHSPLTNDGALICDQHSRDLPFEVFEPRHAIRAQVEVKSLPHIDIPDMLRHVLAEVDPDAPFVVTSFDPTVALAYRHDPFPTGFIAKETMPVLDSMSIARHVGADLLMVHGPSLDVTTSDFRHAIEHRGDMQIGAWDVTPDRVAPFIESGLSALCGDDIAGLVAAVSKETP